MSERTMKEWARLVNYERAETAEAEVARVKAERDNAVACLDNLTRTIKELFGKPYQAAIDEAHGDISVNTAMRVAVRQEREAHRSLCTALRELLKRNDLEFGDFCLEMSALLDASEHGKP